MALLYSRLNAVAVDDPEFGHYEASREHGGFDFPDDLSDRLHRFHFRGKPAWETEDERNLRLHGEEAARRRDPETLYNAVADIASLARQFAGQVPAPDLSRMSPDQLAALAEAVKAAQSAQSGENEAKPARGRRTAAKPDDAG